MAAPGSVSADYLETNGKSIANAIAGQAAHGGERSSAGACLVVNMANSTVRQFAVAGGQYKNCYDVERDRVRLGYAPPSPSKKRTTVDAALAHVHKQSAEDVYFVAVEYNGCGIGFYGDFCLVLKDDVAAREYPLLDRNSYDLLREPLLSKIDLDARTQSISVDDARALQAAEMAGVLNRDLAPIAAIKVLESRQPVTRLITTAGISAGVLEDEDYLEVLRPQTFTTYDVREARLTSSDASIDERIARRELQGEPPSDAETLWHEQREAAESRLRALGIPVRVVPSLGRSKG